MGELTPKVIVITGASSGFGKGAALAFANKGASLVLAARRDYLLDELVSTCESAGAKALAIPCDVSSESDVDELARAAIERFGGFDVWINNAGAAAIGLFTDVPLEEHKKVIETDLLGTIYGSYRAMQQFHTNGGGILINVASMIGKVPAPYYSSYSAAKHGVVGFSASLRQELQEQKIEDIHVCTVLPMAMDTPFFDHAANYSGHEALPIPPVDDAQKVIDAFVDLVTNPKDEVPVGKGSGVFSMSDKLAPALTESMMAKNTHKTLEEAKPAQIDQGSLSQPDPRGTGVKGDLK